MFAVQDNGNILAAVISASVVIIGALLALAVQYGSLKQEVKDLREDIKDLKRDVDDFPAYRSYPYNRRDWEP